MLNFNGKCFVTQKQLAAQGRKTMFALKSTMIQLYLNHFTLLSLFDTYVCTILNYGCEVWGSHRGPDCILRVSYECLYRMCENSKKYCSSR